MIKVIHKTRVPIRLSRLRIRTFIFYLLSEQRAWEIEDLRKILDAIKYGVTSLSLKLSLISSRLTVSVMVSRVGVFLKGS